MLQAQGYTPAMIYVEAGEDIQKHMAVSILVGGTVKPADPSLGATIGFAMQDAPKGSFLPVQVDGVLYGYERLALLPGVWYYQGHHGELTTDKSSNGHIVGFAVTDNIFRIVFMFAGGSSGGGGGSHGGDGGGSTPEVIDGGSLSDSLDISDTVDGSGTLSDAINAGWDEWDSISGGSLSDLFESGKIEGANSVDGGSLSDSTNTTGIDSGNSNDNNNTVTNSTNSTNSINSTNPTGTDLSLLLGDNYVDGGSLSTMSASGNLDASNEGIVSVGATGSLSNMFSKGLIQGDSRGVQNR